MSAKFLDQAGRRILRAAVHFVAIAGVSITALPAFAAKHAERDGIGVMSLKDVAKLSGKKKASGAAGVAAAAAAPVTIDPRKSLVITESGLLNQFPILAVLNAIAAGSPNSMTAKMFYDQWMDVHNVAPGIGQGAHCNDELTGGMPTMNGFSLDCPRAEGKLVGTNPTDGNPNSFRVIAVVNRFDLATDPKKGGTDCGEYRIVYAKMSGFTVTTDRMTIIFEGVLPNPKPNGVDLSGCLPVAQFLSDLSSNPDPTDRIAKLKTFYFTGLPGFEPVVKASHYGFATPAAGGQIRTNLFMQFNWVLREYHLAVVGGRIKAVPSPNAINPPGQLFDETDAHPKGPQFRTDFLNQVASLAASDINTFNMNTLPSTYNNGDSDEQNATKSNPAANFSRSPNFAAAIQSKLTAIGSTLTPSQIVERAMANTCAGCHQLSNGHSIGGGLTYPSSLQFVHITETQRDTSPEGQSRFMISSALTNVFLPHRKAVLEAFMNGTP